MKHDAPTHLLWDLGNTLVAINSFSMARYLGLTDMMLYSLIERKPHREIFDKAVALLALLSDREAEISLATAYGKPIPPLVRQWLTGDITRAQTNRFLERDSLESYVPKGFFSSKREARLVKKLLEALTQPETFTAATRMIKEGIRLLEECAAQYDEQGNQRNTLFVLSNWDPYSFKTMLEATHLQDLFTYFERKNLIISGEVGLIKPYQEIYSYVLATYQLTPSQCVLIDDQVENILGAQHMGMHAILFKEGNYEEVRKELCALKVIR